MTTRRTFMAAAAAATVMPWLTGAAEAAPAILLARDARGDEDPSRYLISEKLDGVRALWDGKQLRFRSGRAVAAPRWFVDRLPGEPMDGELWLARGEFDTLSGIVRRTLPRDDEWRRLSFQVFEAPGDAEGFAERVSYLGRIVDRSGFTQLRCIEQRRGTTIDALQRQLADVVNAGGEGLMLHRADAPYTTGRSDALLKLKPMQDREAIVTGHEPGRGKHAGRLGALRVRDGEGREFLLGTGLSDAQREAPPAVGTVVTYVYRGQTPGGAPRFASFLRVRDAF